jgi:dipeptidyl aminopeptidase/acylaminoacyl peptidase
MNDNNVPPQGGHDAAAGGVSRRGLLAAAAASAGALALGEERAEDAAAADAPGAPPASGLSGAPPAGAPHRPFAPWPDAPRFNTAFVRLVGEAAAGGADFEEVFFAAQRVGPQPTAAAWTRELAALGRGLLADARKLRARDPQLARATALRGQNYLRAAEFSISPAPATLPTKLKLFREMRAGFALAAMGDGATPRVSAVRVPYGKDKLYAYLVDPVKRPRHRRVPAVVFFGGIDTIGEQLLLKAALRFAERGIATLILDGPGMGATLRFLKLPGRYDYEPVAKAAFDWLEGVPWIDDRRIAIVGMSLGGYYAARCAAFERRARACVIWGGVYALTSSGATADGEEEQYDPEAGAALAAQALWVIGGNSTTRFGRQFPKYNLAGVARRIRCPTLLVYGADDELVPVADAHRLRDEIRGPKTMHMIPSGTPGATHCQADFLPAAWAPMLPWLTEHLG